jgi:16S rRNA (guanine527-N7)-methyltransferase
VALLDEAVRLGLLGPAERGRLTGRHIDDSLAFVPYAAVLPGAITDVGSGAGLPGIPLALALPEREVRLLERSAGRARFLRRAVRTLGLEARVEVVEADVRRAPLDTPGVVARASLPPDAMLELAQARAADWLVVWVGAEQAVSPAFRVEAGGGSRRLAIWERVPR